MQISKRVTVLLLSFFITMSCGQDLSITDANKPILVNKHSDHFSVNLPSNPSTGYSWRLKDFDTTILSATSQRYEHPSKSIPGAGGIESFIFKIDPKFFVVKRVTQVSFIYLRAWNLNVAKTLVFTIVAE